MRIYLDVCCLSRPFDDQTQSRIAMETQAVISILERCRSGSFCLVVSEFITFEINNTVNPDRRRAILRFMDWASESIKANEKMRVRANELQDCGYKALDAVHIACAEIVGVDVLLTTDDKLLKRYRRGNGNVQVSVENPLSWLTEKEFQDENS